MSNGINVFLINARKNISLKELDLFHCLPVKDLFIYLSNQFSKIFTTDLVKSVVEMVCSTLVVPIQGSALHVRIKVEQTNLLEGKYTSAAGLCTYPGTFPSNLTAL